MCAQETYRRVDLERVATDVVTVPARGVVDADEQRVVHDVQVLEELGVAAELLGEERAALGPDLELLAAVDPVEVLEHRARVLGRPRLGVLAPDGAALEVVRLVHVLVRREKVVHDHEVDLVPARELDAVEAVEAREERVRVLPHVLVVLREHAPEELVLRVVDRLDDEAVVAREVEERAGLARAAELGEDVLVRERH
jgi:hypothetical protein